MRKNTKKIISAILTIVSLLLMSTMVFATEGIIGKVDGKGSIDDGNIKNMINQLLGMVSSFAMACATGMLIYLGIKYTMASANEKAELKNSSIKYMIGAIIILAASAVFKIVEALMAEVGDAL